MFRGDEIGYFAFGGSTVITLFKPNSIKFDEDLIINSHKPVETLVKVRKSKNQIDQGRWENLWVFQPSKRWRLMN